MSARTVDLRAGLDDPLELDPVVEHLLAGGLVVHPSETVYGFGGLATESAVVALQRLKGRSDERPFLLLVSSPAALPELIWTAAARELATVFWPGALTLVLADPGRSFPAGVRGATGGVAVRVSSHPVARALVERLGRPMTSTSANAPGAPPALTVEEAVAVARAGGDGDLWVLDAGPLPASAPSTVVDCTAEEPVVVRAGATPVDRLRCVLPGIRGNR
ncbi:MAG: threonylcarbamoyl-AMP synthase [Gemmatimonadetes bacterium]|nr:threonylcarbamoyl-AMP synthase [Gemmatimonadota bacterium]